MKEKIILFYAVLIAAMVAPATNMAAETPNVLFIAVDDLRDRVGHLEE